MLKRKKHDTTIKMACISNKNLPNTTGTSEHYTPMIHLPPYQKPANPPKKSIPVLPAGVLERRKFLRGRNNFITELHNNPYPRLIMTSVADPGCLILTFFLSCSRNRIRTFFIPDPGSYIKRGMKSKNYLFHAHNGFRNKYLKSKR
jgi:hypothetical protein